MHVKKWNVTARLDAHCHMLSYTYWCIANRHTHTHKGFSHTHTRACVHWRMVLPRRPRGQWDRA